MPVERLAPVSVAPTEQTPGGGPAADAPNYDREAAIAERQAALNAMLLSKIDLLLIGVMFTQLGENRKTVGTMRSEAEIRLIESKELDSELED